MEGRGRKASALFSWPGGAPELQPQDPREPEDLDIP